MSSIIEQYYSQLFDYLLSVGSKIQVATEFHEQVKQVDAVLKNDYTAIISTIIDFMIQCATVDININTNNTNLTKIFEDWKQNLNSNINVDIPRGLRSFTEQYFRERWRSSLIVLNMKWERVDGLELPTKMWLYDSSNIYVDRNNNGDLTTTKYYIGKPDKSGSNQLPKRNMNILVRKPYNQWIDKYSTPYLIKHGALYHALFQKKLIEKLAEMVHSTFPALTMIKMGSAEAMAKGQMPTKEDMDAMEEKFKDLKNKYDEYTASRALFGAFPYDVNLEEYLPTFSKILDEKIFKPLDKKLLFALGLIELRGFSSDREEAILNPKVLVEEIEDAVLDYVELLDDVMAEIKKRNINNRKYMNLDIRLSSGIIKSFITNDMRVMLRSWYDRGLISKEDAVENTTPLNFETQISKRDRERKEKLNQRLYPPVIVNLEKDINDPSEPVETPEETKEQTPEKKKTEQDMQSTAEIEIITEPMKTIRSIPEEIRAELNKDEQKLFKQFFNEKFEQCDNLEMDDWLKEKTAMEYAVEKIQEYIYAPYRTINELPDAVKNNMTKELQRIFMNVVNNSLKNGDSEEIAFKKAWTTIKKIAEKGKDDKWRMKKK